MSEKKEAKKAKKAAKKAAKGRKGDKGFKIFIAIVLVVAIIGEFAIGLTFGGKLDKLTQTVAASATEEGGDSAEAGIELTPGTYGGVDFKTMDDVVKYYNDAFNKTKAKTAKYTNSDGAEEIMYDFIGEEPLVLKEGSLLVNGSANAMLNGMVPGILSKMFTKNIVGLPPSANRHPDGDTDIEGKSMQTSRVVVEDIKAASVEEKDGKVVLTIIPVATEMSTKGMDSQGHFFNSLGALDSVIEGIGMITWASGSTADNVKATYEGGKVVVTIDPATGEIVEADYNMVVNVDVQHANLSALKDKSASLTILYDNHFPVSDEMWAEKGYTRV